MTLDFLALDVETANRAWGSICSIGLVQVNDGVISRRTSWLVRPPQGLDNFESRNTSIHGITAEMVQAAPRFHEVWDQVLGLVGDNIVVAHNAAFDVGAIRQACDAAGVPWPSLTYACTKVLSRSLITLPSYSLPIVCDALGVRLEAHHDAAADAEAAASVAIQLANRVGATDLNAVAHAAGVGLGKIDSTGWFGCRRVASTSGLAKSDAPLPPKQNQDADAAHPLFGQVVVFTGAMAMKRSDAQAAAAALGAIPESDVTKRTTMLVIGDGFRGTSLADFATGKAAQATEWIERGHRIEVLTEEDFLFMLADDGSGVRKQLPQAPSTSLRVLVVDFETSGLSPARGDRAVWLGASRLVEGVPKPEQSLAIAGTDGLGFYGDPPGDVPRVSREDAARYLARVMSDSDVVVAHNAAFDSKFAEAEFLACGMPVPSVPWVCTMRLAQALLPELPNHKLATCLDHFGIDPGVPHSAPDDSLATAHLFSRLLEFSPTVADASALLAWLRSTDRAQTQESIRVRRGRSGELSVTLFDESDFGLEISIPTFDWEEAARLYESGDWPICDGLTFNQIDDTEHRDAHARNKYLASDDFQSQVDRAFDLLLAGCPSAPRELSALPTYADRPGRRGEYEAALVVLRLMNDYGVDDASATGEVLRYVRDVGDLKGGWRLLAKAHEELEPWLAEITKCDECDGSPRSCCLDMSSSLTSSLLEAAGSEDLDALMLFELRQVAPAHNPIGARLAALRPNSGARDSLTWARVLESLAQRAADAGSTADAIVLLKDLYRSGRGSRWLFDRLSLLAERAGDFELALEVSEAALNSDDLNSRLKDTFTRRAARCSDRLAEPS